MRECFDCFDLSICDNLAEDICLGKCFERGRALCEARFEVLLEEFWSKEDWISPMIGTDLPEGLKRMSRERTDSIRLFFKRISGSLICHIFY